MAFFLLLTDAAPERVLPSLRTAGLDHKHAPLDLPADRIAALAPVAVLVDAATDADRGFGVLLDLRARVRHLPTVALVAEADLERHPWSGCADDLIAPDASPAAVRVRLDLLRRRTGRTSDDEIRLGPVLLDTLTYRATVDGRPLNLTFKEFELLRFLAAQPGRVFTRETLLREVWGYDFFGGTRTVDVHIRRLRAKLGTADEHLIETVRGVGYRARELPL